MLDRIFDTYVYNMLKKKTSFFQNITSTYKHFGQRPGFNEKSHFPKVIFFKKRRFPSPKLDPPLPTVTFHASKWHKVLTARGVDVQASKRGTSEFFPVDSLIFLIFGPKKKNSPIYFTYRVDQFSFLNFGVGNSSS